MRRQCRPWRHRVEGSAQPVAESCGLRPVSGSGGLVGWPQCSAVGLRCGPAVQTHQRDLGCADAVARDEVDDAVGQACACSRGMANCSILLQRWAGGRALKPGSSAAIYSAEVYGPKCAPQYRAAAPAAEHPPASRQIFIMRYVSCTAVSDGLSTAVLPISAGIPVSAEVSDRGSHGAASQSTASTVVPFSNPIVLQRSLLRPPAAIRI